eukprot:4360531-Pleurochrysis_carterae.AAC.2
MVPCFCLSACPEQGRHDCWDRMAAAASADLACPFVWQRIRGPVAGEALCCRVPRNRSEPPELWRE